MTTDVDLAIRPPRPGAADREPDRDAGSEVQPPPGDASRPPLELRVHSIGYLAETIRSFELRAPDGSPLPPFTAGSHIEVAMPGDLSRSYSLINPPEPRDRYVIAVSRDPNSRGGSAYMCETVRVGDLLTVAPPHNTFPLAESAEASVFLAGGIGITPILSMIEQLEALGCPWQLHYAVRSRSHGAFLDVLADLDAMEPGRVRLHVDAEAEGRLLDVPAIVRAQPDGAELYCCGPTPMIDAFKAACGDRDPDRIHVEHFTGTHEKPTTGFQVVLARSKKELTVPAGRTIMEVIEEAGMRVAHSCREGVCGTCETRVLEGIPDHKDNVLSPREQASNKVMMICCSGAKSDRLVLDL